MICHKQYRVELTDYLEDRESHGFCSEACSDSYMRDYCDMTDEQIASVKEEEVA